MKCEFPPSFLTPNVTTGTATCSIQHEEALEYTILYVIAPFK